MIIFDLQTLCDSTHRKHHIDINYASCRGCGSKLIPYDHRAARCEDCAYNLEHWKPNWDAYNAACMDDKPVEYVRYILEGLYFGHGADVQIWSGHTQDEKWLNKHIPRAWYQCLKMRPIGNTEPGWKLKEEWLDEACYVTKWGTRHDIDFVFDSDPASIAMWRRRGIFVFNCRQDNASSTHQ